MNGIRTLLDEFDEELDALIRLIGNRPDLLLLVRRKRIFRALRVGSRCEKEKRSRNRNRDLQDSAQAACCDAGGQMKLSDGTPES